MGLGAADGELEVKFVIRALGLELPQPARFGAGGEDVTNVPAFGGHLRVS